MKKSKVIFIVILLSSLVAGLLWWATHKNIANSLVVSGTLQAAEVKFGSRQSGRIKLVLAEEGQILQTNDVILTLENPELESQRDALKANVEAHKAFLQELKNGPRTIELDREQASLQQSRAAYDLTKHGNRQEDIEAAKAQQESAGAEKVRAEQFLKRREKLFAEQLITADQLEEAKKNYLLASKKQEEFAQKFTKTLKGSRKEEIDERFFAMKAKEAGYKNLKLGTRPEKLLAEENKLLALQAQLDELESKVRELKVLSPCNCELADFEIEPGNLILSNQILGMLIDLDKVWLEAYLPEEVYGKVWPGDKVKVTSLSYPAKSFVGKVKHVGVKAEFTPRNIQTIEGRKQQVFKVKVAIDNRKRLFRPGMDLEMKFDFKDKHHE